MRSTWAVSLLTLPFLGGCFQSFPDDADGSRQPVALGDAGPTDSDAGPADVGAARWLANGPQGDQEEGPVSFELACVDAEGAPERCSFACSLDDLGEEPCGVRYDAAWVGTNAFGEARAHRFCVRVTPVDGGPGSTACRDWVAQPYARPFVWIEEGLDASRTEMSFTPRCAQRSVDGSLGEPRTDCLFRFSLDSQPYLDVGASFALSHIEPGPHVLRAEVRGPGDLSYVMHVSEHRWTVVDDAQPPVARGFTVPELKSQAELDALGLGHLVARYGEYAVACGGRDDPGVYAEQMRTYLSYGFADGPDGPNTRASDQRIDACAQALSERPAECPAPPGISRQNRTNGPFSVRPPELCHHLVHQIASVFGPRRCLTALDCAGACEYPEAWGLSPVLGYCAEDNGAETREHIYCRSRGCDEGLYCAGTCQRVSQPLEACNPDRRGVDCPRGYTCSGGATPRCLEATAQLGDACNFDSDCREGICELRVCRGWE